MNPAADSGELTGWDIATRLRLRPVAIVGGVAFVAYTLWRASEGEKAGGVGALLVLFLVTVMGLKLAAETLLFSAIGGDPSPRQTVAKAMTGPLARLTTLRFVLGCFGGLILPLGAQILSAGAKNIPPVLEPGPPAVFACLALVCLVPGELIERVLWRRANAQEPDAAAS
ncbi:MAG: hypothetical protein AAFV43_01110 [Planctomycetota bacterium]